MTTNLEKMTFAERVTRLAGIDDLPQQMTITELSNKSGIQYDRLRRMLNDKRPLEPYPDEIIRLAEVLNVSPLLLLTGRREEGMFTCEETGLYNSTVDALRQRKKERTFSATKEVFDLLANRPDVTLALYSYLFGALAAGRVPITLPDGTRQLYPVDLESGIETPYTRHSPEQLARLDLMDKLQELRQEVQQDQRRNDPTGAARSTK